MDLDSGVLFVREPFERVRTETVASCGLRTVVMSRDFVEVATLYRP